MSLACCGFPLLLCKRASGENDTCNMHTFTAAAGDVLGVLLYLDAHPHQLHNRTIFQSEVRLTLDGPGLRGALLALHRRHC